MDYAGMFNYVRTMRDNAMSNLIDLHGNEDLARKLTEFIWDLDEFMTVIAQRDW